MPADPKLAEIHELYNKHQPGIILEGEFIRPNDCAIILCSCGKLLGTAFRANTQVAWGAPRPVMSFNRMCYRHCLLAIAIKHGIEEQFTSWVTRDCGVRLFDGHGGLSIYEPDAPIYHKTVDMRQAPAWACEKDKYVHPGYKHISKYL